MVRTPKQESKGNSRASAGRRQGKGKTEGKGKEKETHKKTKQSPGRLGEMRQLLPPILSQLGLNRHQRESLAVAIVGTASMVSLQVFGDSTQDSLGGQRGGEAGDVIAGHRR